MSDKISLATISSKEAESIYPGGNSLDEAKKKGIVDNSIYEKPYMELQEAYLTVFNYFLCEKASLNSYQKELDSSDLNFPGIEDNVHMKLGSFGRNNICIRNSIYVERLTKEQIQKFQDEISNGEITINKELLDIVEETWKNIIIVALEPEYIDSSYNINYEMRSITETQALNTALTFDIIFGIDYNEDGNIIDEDTEQKKLKYAKQLKSKMEENISSRLDCDVTVFIIIE